MEILYVCTCTHIGVDAQLYEWNCSPQDFHNNHYTLPDLRYQDDPSVENGLTKSDSNVNIFPLPSMLNCSGTVSAVKYNYAGYMGDITLGTDYHLFTLLTLKQNGTSFVITNAIDVHTTPSLLKCTDRHVGLLVGTFRFCSDTLYLDSNDHFSLPASNFAFGIVPKSSINQFRYNSKVFPEYRVEQYIFPVSHLGIPAIGNTFKVNDSSKSLDKALRAFQFMISKYIIIAWEPLYPDSPSRGNLCIKDAISDPKLYFNRYSKEASLLGTFSVVPMCL